MSSWYIFADQVFFRSDVLQHILLRSFAANFIKKRFDCGSQTTAHRGAGDEMAFVQSLSVVTEAATFSNSSVQDCSYHFQTKIIYVLPNYDCLNRINAAMLSLVMLTFP